MAEDEMVGWHHRLDAHEFKQTPETVKDGGTWQDSPWDCKESDMIE